MLVEEVIRQGKGREENKLKICTGFSHSLVFVVLPSKNVAFTLPKTQFKIVI